MVDLVHSLLGAPWAQIGFSGAGLATAAMSAALLINPKT